MKWTVQYITVDNSTLQYSIVYYRTIVCQRVVGIWHPRFYLNRGNYFQQHSDQTNPKYTFTKYSLHHPVYSNDNKKCGTFWQHESPAVRNQVCTWANLQNLQGGAAQPPQSETRWTEKGKLFCSLPLWWRWTILIKVHWFFLNQN